MDKREMKRRAKAAAKKMITEARSFSQRAEQILEQTVEENESRTAYFDKVIQYLVSRTNITTDAAQKLVDKNHDDVLEGLDTDITPSICAFRLAFRTDVDFNTAGLTMTGRFITEYDQPAKH